MKLCADQKRRDVNFQMGDLVYLKLQPYRQSSVVFRSSLKLTPRFFGPYKVIEWIGPVAYRLEQPCASKIHDVFHVSLLRKYLGSPVEVSPELPPISSFDSILPQPERVLDTRVVQKGHYRPKIEVLILWKGTPCKDATWKNLCRFSKQYPKFILADKDVASGGA